MLYVQEKVVKLGGVYLGGQVTSVEVHEAGSIYVAQDEKGKVKKSQPVGYENAKVMIDILLEDTRQATTLEQLTEMQQLFRPYGQDRPRLIPIVNEDCAARGITNVYFKSLSSKKNISESKRIVSLELWVPDTAEIQVKKVQAKTGGAKKAEDAGKAESVKKTKNAGKAEPSEKSKNKKTKEKSPACDDRDSSSIVGTAKSIFDVLKVKGGR